MPRVTTYHRPDRSLKKSNSRRKSIKLTPFSPTKELAKEKFTSELLWECLREGDSVGAIDAIKTFIEARMTLGCAAKTANLYRSTVRQALRKGSNPSVQTLCKLIHAVCQEENSKN